MLYLASTSPRRRDLLTAAGIDFVLHPPGVEPEGEGDAEARAILRAAAKATGAPAAPGPILAVDTVVDVDGEELGKPADRAAAQVMLRRLAGRQHQVHTGHCLRLPNGGLRQELCSSTVRFARLSDSAIEAYLELGDWQDKAGGYGIQGPAFEFAALVRGDLDTVIGLNVAAVQRLTAGLPGT